MTFTFLVFAPAKDKLFILLSDYDLMPSVRTKENMLMSETIGPTEEQSIMVCLPCAASGLMAYNLLL